MTTMADERVMLPLLAEPDTYRCNTLDLLEEDPTRDYWINVFEAHLQSLVCHCMRSEAHTPDAPARTEAFATRFADHLADLKRRPDQHGRLDILLICHLREQYLREQHIADPYQPVKADENAAALKLLPGVLAEIDAIEEGGRLEALVRGVFAGNKFDLGATSTNQQFDEGGTFSFHAAREAVSDRPWLIDDFDALRKRWHGIPHRKAVVFVDNAGADVTLGMVPLMREMLRRGTQVIVTANTHPSLNDITHDELGAHLAAMAAMDPVIAEALGNGRLQRIASGNDAPLIDFRRVDPQLAAACADCDLLVIEGMGRAVETNLYAKFTCDTLKLAMVKEDQLATMLGGGLYDVICKFETGA